MSHLVTERQCYYYHHLRATHHLLELFEIDVAVAVGIDVSDHPPAVTEGALLPQPPHHGVQLLRRDQPVLVQIVQLERLPELPPVATAAAVELAELLQINVAVAVPVQLRHHALHLVRRRFGSQRRHHLLQLRARDLAVAVLVELAEDLAHLFFVHGDAERRIINLRVQFGEFQWL
ncbi:hypothetical protein JHK84_049202 [Glycine max]|nr:hypothetical protein JHK84_049202 [Glycine max]